MQRVLKEGPDTLLRFRVANHRSIRDEQELSLVAVPERGGAKPKAGETPPTVRVAGIYGSNASGKSNVLDALRWMRRAVHDSHTRWEPGGGIPRDPFLLDDDSPRTPSFFEVVLTHGGTRYTYGFEVDDSRVAGEWLYAYPHGRAQRWFEREPGDGREHTYRFGRSLTGEVEQIRRLTRENSLYLSAAASNGHRQLFWIYDEIVEGISSARQDESDQRDSIDATKRLLSEGDSAESVFRILAVADLGITGWRLEASSGPRFFGKAGGDLLFDYKSYVAHNSKDLVLERRSGGTTRTLRLSQESEGTRSWVSLIGPLVRVLRSGSVFLVDGIDSSLHPMISSTVIKMFTDSEVNPKDAQLVFASHDTTLLGRMMESRLLNRDEVWFTEKDAEGATQLFSLAEFRPRGEENTERGYLQGRYGAVPYVDFDEIRSVFSGLHREHDEPSSQGEGEPLAEHADP
ncbi:ATP-binding protein [Streptomonospora sediminis]